MTAIHAMIPGYTYGAGDVAVSPITDEEFALLKQTVLFSEEDVHYLRMAGDVLKEQVEVVLDVWYGFVGAHPHLLAYFSTVGAQPQPIADYLARVRKRFGQWILDTCQRPYNRAWLDYQMEIGLRHHSSKKNQADGVESTASIPVRYMVAFIVPMTVTIKSFLVKGGHSAEEVEKMYTAWFKAVTLQATLWSYPYVREGQF